MKQYYIIMPVADITADLALAIDGSIGQDVYKSRKSIDGTKCVVEVFAPIPEQLRIYNAFTYERILEVMQDPEWTATEEGGGGQGMFSALTSFFSPK